MDGLVKRYRDGSEALKGIGFKVERGKIFGLLGPNGAGKTTTVSILTTMMKKTGGRVTICGIDVNDNPKEIRKRIGVVFQGSTSDIELTGMENLRYIAGLNGKYSRGVDQKINDLLEIMKLKEYANTQVRKYSGGMKRKLELAAALLNDPEIIFLDEPTIGLDPSSRAEFWDYVVALKQKTGITVFLNTHYLDEAEKLCDKIAILDQGQVIASGSPEDLKSRVKGDIVMIRLRDPPPSFEDRISALHGVNGIVRTSSDFSLKCEDSVQAIPLLVSLLKTENIDLEEMSVIHPSLEQVFLEVTGYRFGEAIEDDKNDSK